MKRLIVVLAMMAGSVFLAAPASAEGDATAPETVVVEEPAPVVEEPVPVVEEPAPVVEKAATVTSKVAPVKIKVVVDPEEDVKKLVVCKYVGTPPGTPDHIIVTDAPKDFNGDFPFTFPDAQDSIAIRFAIGNEQPGDEELVRCPGFVAPVEVRAEEPTADPATCEDDGMLNVPADTDAITYTVDREFDGPGDYTVTATANEGFTLIGESEFDVTVEGQLPASECIEPAVLDEDPDPEPDPEVADEVAVLPDTGGAPLWILPLGGALAAGGVMFLRGARRPVAIGGSWGGDTGFSLAMPPMLKDAPVRAAVSADAKSEWLMLAGGVAAVVAALFFGSRIR